MLNMISLLLGWDKNKIVCLIVNSLPKFIANITFTREREFPDDTRNQKQRPQMDSVYWFIPFGLLSYFYYIDQSYLSRDVSTYSVLGPHT